MNIVFIGPPGAGKGTQAKRLLAHLGIVHLSTGELLRNAQRQGTSLGEKATEFMNHGNLVPDELVVSLVGERLEIGDCDQCCLFDGFPRTIEQARSLDEILKDRGDQVDSVVELIVDEKDSLTRRVTEIINANP